MIKNILSISILSLAILPSLCYSDYTNVISELQFQVNISLIDSAIYTPRHSQFWYHVGYRAGCREAIEIIHAIDTLDGDYGS